MSPKRQDGASTDTIYRPITISHTHCRSTHRRLWRALAAGLGALLLTTAALAHERDQAEPPQEPPPPKRSDKAAEPPTSPLAKRSARIDKAEQGGTTLDKHRSDRSKTGPTREPPSDERVTATQATAAKRAPSTISQQTVRLPWGDSVVTVVRKPKPTATTAGKAAPRLTRPATSTNAEAARAEQERVEPQTATRRPLQGPTRSAAHTPTSPLLAATLAQPEGETAPLQGEDAHRDTSEVVVRWLLQDSRKMNRPPGIPFPVGVSPSAGGGTVTYKGTFE